MVSAIPSQAEIQVFYYLFFESYNKRDDTLCLAHPMEALKLFNLEKRKLEERKIINYNFNNAFTRSSLSTQFVSAVVQHKCKGPTTISIPKFLTVQGAHIPNSHLIQGSIVFFSFSNQKSIKFTSKINVFLCLLVLGHKCQMSPLLTVQITVVSPSENKGFSISRIQSCRPRE